MAISSRGVREAVARGGIGLALLLGGLGMFITFYPGSAAHWFGVTAALAVIGLLSPNRRDRVAALLLVAASLWMAWLGYQEGVRYQEWMRLNMRN
jgi:hypothetical protein